MAEQQAQVLRGRLFDLTTGTLRDGDIAILTLDNPARRNALSLEMRLKLTEALRRLDGDADVRALVLTGTGGHFCAGGDIAGQGSGSLADGRERFRMTHEMVRLLVRCSKPSIAAVEGWAAGAGLSLALLCDSVVAGEGAKFSAPFGKVGLIADLGLLHTLPRRIGEGRARQMLLYGEAMEAREALATGLDEALDWEREAQAALMTTEDHAEGRNAFLEKRAPRFAGR